MNWRNHIAIDPTVLAGKPRVKGTRISVALIRDLLAQGWSRQSILDNYPQLHAGDLQAVLEFVAAQPKNTASDPQN